MLRNQYSDGSLNLERLDLQMFHHISINKYLNLRTGFLLWKICGTSVHGENGIQNCHTCTFFRFCLLVLKTRGELGIHLHKEHSPKSPHQDMTVVTSKYGRKWQAISTFCHMKRRKNVE
jgi:hypothetical protein